MKDEEDWDGSRGEGLFEDLHFPADDSSLFSDFSTPIARLQGDIVWRRPQEISQSPALLPDNMNQGHAKQGLLGDCWFLCACTVLLKNQHLLDRVLPPDQPQWGASGYRGCFCFSLWQQGRWAEVTVDDRLPCIGATLCFSRCHAPNAFWVALLEKAYAKLHGSYERLWAGQVSEALVDLTGGLAECRSLGSGGPPGEEERGSGGPGEEERGSGGPGEEERGASQDSESLGSGGPPGEEERGASQDSDRGRRRRLNLNQLQAVRDGCALSCSTHSTPAVGGGGELAQQHHALSVMEWVDVRRTSGGTVRLLRIRNPWGRRCCGGAWTESGEGWGSVDPVCALGLQGRTEEGDFWLDEAEFVSQFDDVTVGYPIDQEGHLQSIYTGNVLTHSTQLVGRWMKGHSAGGCRNSSSYGSNPKFWLNVCERGEVLLSLLQHGRGRHMAATQYAQRPQEGTNNTNHQHYQAIALHMWKVEKKRLNLARTLSSPPCASSHCHAYQREVVLHAHLEPGYHLLVPSTFLPGHQASFLIRAFSLSPLSLSALKAPGPSLPPASDGEWETSVFRGAWEAGTTGGGSRNFPSHCRNPRFPFTVREEDPAPKTAGANNVRVHLHQNRADTDLHPIGFHVYKVPGEGVPEPTLPRDEEPVASCLPHCYMQDVSLACRLPAGHYVVVPSTYQPDCAASFTLTVALTIHRRVVKSQERLGRSIQEVSHISVMRSSF